jgi:DNA helicase-2/ATP-dependent DNA helicase PcrA
VILDDAGAGWNLYSFGNFLSGVDTSETRLLRTRNLFYVCCSRSKRNLAVIDLGCADGKEDIIKKLFGDEFCCFGIHL